MSKKSLILLLVLTVVGGVLRFHTLDWDGPYSLHPDERNIAAAVTNLDFAEGDFNPNFFAYGSLPIYIARAVVELTGGGDSFGQAILVSRFLSAMLSTLLIPLAYFVTLRVLKFRNSKFEIRNWAMAAALLTAFAPGLIQFAHFGTFEVWLALEYLLILYFALRVVESGGWCGYIGLSVALAMALATKIVSLALLPILPLAWCLHNLEIRELEIRNWAKSLFNRKLFVSLVLMVSLAFLFAPYQLLDLDAFLASMNYEGPVARGTLDVFYTQQFIETTPVIYQLTRVFPYVLGLPAITLSLLALTYFLIKLGSGFLRSFRNSKFEIRNWPILLLLASIGLYLTPHLTFFVKWTRYMIPVLPLLVVLVTTFLAHLYEEPRRSSKLVVKSRSGSPPDQPLRQRPYEELRRSSVYFVTNLVVAIAFGWTVLQGINFFSIYLQPDPRIKAAQWAKENIPANAKILSETYDLGVLPFNSQFSVSNITLYNTYNIDDPNATQSVNELYDLAQNSDYIVLPSQRVWATRLRLCNKYPHGCQFYQQLFNGSLGYQQIAQFSRQSWIELPFVYSVSDLEFSASDFRFVADETAYIFDNPTVLIFKNTRKP